MDETTINKGFEPFPLRLRKVMRIPVCALVSSVVLNMGLNFQRAMP